MIDGIGAHGQSCLDVGYHGAFLGGQLDLTTIANEEYMAFSLLCVPANCAEVTGVGIASQVFPGSQTADDFPRWIDAVVKEIFGTMMGKYQAEDVFLAFIVDQGTNMVNACGW